MLSRINILTGAPLPALMPVYRSLSVAVARPRGGWRYNCTCMGADTIVSPLLMRTAALPQSLPLSLAPSLTRFLSHSLPLSTHSLSHSLPPDAARCMLKRTSSNLFSYCIDALECLYVHSDMEACTCTDSLRGMHLAAICGLSHGM